MAKFIGKTSELRQLWELERVVFKYSPFHPGSRRARAFVEKGLLNEFAEQNPQLSVVTVPFQRKPRVIGEYGMRVIPVIVLLIFCVPKHVVTFPCYRVPHLDAETERTGLGARFRGSN
mmetsp:Transcript_31568/g.122252  ORF Transcript_31568/g.122252 Transcript_31568/m.122252 type:complete len:118 (+) Transcript_31568:582-935(+)